MFACHDFSETALPVVSTLLADEAWFVHKPAQVELQLDWSQLPYPAHPGPLPQKAALPNAQYTKKAPTKLLTSFCHNQISFLIILHIYDICNPKHFFFLMHAS